ncbi:MAG: ROK family protein [Melioribacteraceae bacterium]|nr:ROK family protein [Melioribacteraceae bacterium]
MQKIEAVRIKGGAKKDEVIDAIFSLIEKFDLTNVSGIGIGVPSVINIEKGIVYDVQNIPSWDQVPLKEILEKRFKTTVRINNDANCFAVGEKYFGKAKNYNDIIGLIIGTGLGAGVIINNKLYTGRNSGAGEFGMIPFKDNYVEYYCSGQFFKNVYGLTGEELMLMAIQGDPQAIAIFNEYGTNLGEAIKIIMYSLDPQIIVLGGSVSKSYTFFQQKMWDSINSFKYSISLEKIIVEVSEKENISILGAAALFLDSNQDGKNL